MLISNGWVVTAVVCSFLLGSFLSFGIGYSKGIKAGVALILGVLGMDIEEIEDEEEQA